MAAKKTRKRAYIPPANEVVNRRERTAPSRAQRTAQRGARGSQAYQYPTPGLRRTLRRLPIYFLLIFALQYFLVGQEQRDMETSQRLMFAATTSAFVTILFAPFMHVMDRWAYNRYMRRTGQQPQQAKQPTTTEQ
jgi:hypothetical protein